MHILVYLIITFAIPWAIWLMTADMYGSIAYTIISSIIMWIPAAAAGIVHLIYHTKANHYSWRPLIRKNWKAYLIAWFSPIPITFIGCFVYFLIFRDAFTLSNLESTSMPLYLFLLLTIASVIPAGIFNMFFALGEETGWRGFLYPELKARYGRIKAYIITGIIWGLWHTPVNAMGYNYGTGYPGFLFTGIIAMCLSCIVLGIISSYLSDKTGSIWPSALFHGSVNAIGALGLIFIFPDSSHLLGPGITGIIPAIITGLLMMPFLSKSNEQSGKTG